MEDIFNSDILTLLEKQTRERWEVQITDALLTQAKKGMVLAF